MSLSDTAFLKDIGKPRLALSNMRRLLGEPLLLPGFAEQIRDAALAWPASSSWATAFSLLELPQETAKPQTKTNSTPAWPDELEPALQQALSSFYAKAELAAAMLEQAFGKLDLARRRELIAFLLAGIFRADDEPAAQDALLELGLNTAQITEAIRISRAADQTPAADKFFALLSEANLGEALAAGECFNAALQNLAASVSNQNKWPNRALQMHTPLGCIRIGSTGDDLHADPALLILEPGGDDCYTSKAGSADGLNGRPLAAILDLAGNDRYVGNRLLGPGSALFGVCMILDLAGDDCHKAEWIGQAAAMFGVACLEDRAGRDSFQARAFAQAAALAGVATLVERSGNDSFEIGCKGQAYADVLGIAWLTDHAGHDQYIAGRAFPDAERHDDRFLSLAQACAMGWRPFAGGGIAALVDCAGNDSYQADIFGQGVGLWYAAGLLLDLAGNDRYQVFHYGQGAGIHLGLGLLADMAGNDRYDGSMLAQGNAHDYAVGMLVDAAGNDFYSADRLAQGWGMNNSFGLLIDKNGNDAYLAGQPEQAQGMGNDGGAREYGSIGLLLDLAGRDTYSCGAQDGARTRRPNFGIIYDFLTSSGKHE